MAPSKQRSIENARDQVILRMAKGVEALLEAHCTKALPPVAETMKTVAERLHNGVVVLETLVSDDLTADVLESETPPA